MFSPRYAARLRAGERALPLEHPAIHLALYRRGKQVAWVMSEHAPLGTLDDDHLVIGQSAIERTALGWRITVAERAMPSRARVLGTIAIEAESPSLEEAAIGGGALHGWRVLAPRARVRAAFTRPDFCLDAVGYHDRNHGAARLEDSFSRWGWARFHGPDATTVVYSTVDRSGARRALVAHAALGDSAAPRDVTPSPEGGPRRLGWGLALPSRFGADRFTVEPGALLESAPFYARYRARLSVGGGSAPTDGVGEHLDLDRFRSRLVQFLMRYKIRNGFFR